VYGTYALRRTGQFSRTVFDLTVGRDGVLIDGSPVAGTVQGTRLTWTGGSGPCAQGSVTFVPEPVLGSVELYGSTRCDADREPAGCFGARQAADGTDDAAGRVLLPDPPADLKAVVQSTRPAGGLLLWQKWEKLGYTNVTVSRHLAALT
jgi:hypothetical protein